MAELIPFPRRQRPEAEAPDIPTPQQRPTREELRSADRRRMLENLAALVFVTAFLMLAFWVMERVGNYSKALDCMQYRHVSLCK